MARITILSEIAWLILQPFKEKLFTVGNVENIPQKANPTAWVIAANHEDELDPYKIGPFLNFSVWWLVKKELFSYRETLIDYWHEDGWRKWLSPFIAIIFVAVVKFSKTIPVNRDDVDSPINSEAKKKVINLLRNGESVAFFFETGIDREGVVNPMFVYFAVKTNSRILPACINGREIIFGEKFVPKKGCKMRETANQVAKYIYGLKKLVGA